MEGEGTMYIVDRIEGTIVVCELEDKSIKNERLELFPSNIKPGDVVYQVNGRYEINLDATKQRKEHIQQLMNELWE